MGDAEVSMTSDLEFPKICEANFCDVDPLSGATTPQLSPMAGSAPPLPEGGALSHFTRAATMRVLQQACSMAVRSDALNQMIARVGHD
eukprot:Skav216513  [mRNA]  locus=scaffold1123:754512:758366:- [translate_table: standard]